MSAGVPGINSAGDGIAGVSAVSAGAVEGGFIECDGRVGRRRGGAACSERARASERNNSLSVSRITVRSCITSERRERRREKRSLPASLRSTTSAEPIASAPGSRADIEAVKKF